MGRNTQKQLQAANIIKTIHRKPPELHQSKIRHLVNKRNHRHAKTTESEPESKPSIHSMQQHGLTVAKTDHQLKPPRPPVRSAMRRAKHVQSKIRSGAVPRKPQTRQPATPIIRPRSDLITKAPNRHEHEQDLLQHRWKAIQARFIRVRERGESGTKPKGRGATVIDSSVHAKIQQRRNHAPTTGDNRPHLR